MAVEIRLCAIRDAAAEASPNPRIPVGANDRVFPEMNDGNANHEHASDSLHISPMVCAFRAVPLPVANFPAAREFELRATAISHVLFAPNGPGLLCCIRLYDGSLDDNPESSVVHFDVQRDRAVGHVGQELAASAALRADAVGAAGGGLLASMVAAGPVQATCSTNCPARDRNFADVPVGVLWVEMLHWNDDNHGMALVSCKAELPPTLLSRCSTFGGNRVKCAPEARKFMYVCAADTGCARARPGRARLRRHLSGYGVLHEHRTQPPTSSKPAPVFTSQCAALMSVVELQVRAVDRGMAPARMSSSVSTSALSRYITNLTSASWMGIVLLGSSVDDDQTMFGGLSAQFTVLLESLLAVEMNRHARLQLWQQSEAMLLCWNWNVEQTGCSWELSVHKFISCLVRCLCNLVKWFLFSERLTLSRKVLYCFALANNLKVDLFQSSQWDSASLLFLLNSASLLTVGSASWRAQNTLLHERNVLEVAHIHLMAWFIYNLVLVLLLSKPLATVGLLMVGLNWYTTRCIELHPWLPPAILHFNITSELVEMISVGSKVDVLDHVTVAASDLSEMGYDVFHRHFVKKLVLPGMGRHDKEKEMVAGFIVSLCLTHTSTYNMMATTSVNPVDWQLQKVMSATQVWCHCGLLASIKVLQVPWDPGGSELHRLGGKPKLKEGGMSGIIPGWAIICAAEAWWLAS